MMSNYLKTACRIICITLIAMVLPSANSNNIAKVGIVSKVDENAGSASISFGLNTPCGNDSGCSVTYSTVDGSARAGEDYKPQVNKKLSWGFSDDSERTITIEIRDNNTADGDRSFSIEYSQEVGLVSFDSDTITIIDDENAEPNGTINTPTKDLEITVGDAINFSGSAIDPDQDFPLSYLWDFDGGANNSSSEDPGDVTFNTPGTFNITFTVTDREGLSDATPATVTINVSEEPKIPPQARIDTPANSSITINAGDNINLTGTGTPPPDGQQSSLSYLWQFGSGASPSHSRDEDPGSVPFTRSGIYQVVFTVTDTSTGLSASDRLTVRVNERQPPTARIEKPAADTTVRRGDKVFFSGTVFNIEADETVRFEWDFNNDGQADSMAREPGDIAFNTKGTFQVTFTAIDSSNLRGSDTRMITVDDSVDDIVKRCEDDAATPNQDVTCKNVVNACIARSGTAEFLRDCDDFLTLLTPPGQNPALPPITLPAPGIPVDGIHGSVEIQLLQIRTRLFSLRQGMSGINYDDIDFSRGGWTFSGQHLRRLIGGGASADTASNFNGLGFFIAGTINLGEKDKTLHTSGFDFRTSALTLGGDYRVTDNLVLGSALTYMTTDTDIDADGSSLDTEGVSVTLYGSYFASDHAYFDGMLSYGKYRYDQHRNVQYAANNKMVDQQFSSDFDGRQIAVELGLGYEFARERFIFGPTARLSYVDIAVDGYQERNHSNDSGSAWGLAVDEQDFSSLAVSLGGRASYIYTFPWGTLEPKVEFDFFHEFKDSNRSVLVRFSQSDAIPENVFRLTTDAIDKNYFSVGVGFAATFDIGASAALQYRSIVGYENLESHSISAEIRWDF